METGASPFPIVGIGASAGGIQAIETFFRAMPPDGGLGFVVITHLSPHHESLLHEIIQRCTRMPVIVAEDRMLLRSDCVHVMPQNAILTMEGGCFRLRRPDTLHRERNPIDLFFASLAQDCGDYAVGIVLSGGGGDGTLGIKAIKEHGGLTLAQTADGTKPAHADMPGSAIATGLVDHPIPVQEMPSKLIAHRESMARLSRMIDGAAEADGDGAARQRRPIYEALRKQTGHDFSGYKTNTFTRRVRRRMQILEIADLASYAARLEADRDEILQLFRDLLINVTNFFRDQDAFEALETTVIPALFESRGADDTVRIWIPGCATGEEVFSIGILLREHMDTLRHVPRVQIFATDIDDPALLVARAARYPALLLETVSPERRRRFFVEEGGTFTVSKDVRDLCIFSPHSIIRDPPFSRIDLVSCRNLLIYFGAEIQNQVIPIFHYALKPGGYLFLGTSENIGQYGDLFVPSDKKQRIFQARDHGTVKRLPVTMYGPRTAPFGLSQDRALRNVPLRHLVEARVVDRFAPAHAVVNADGDLVYCSQRTGKYLEVPHGPPSRQLLAMARRGLRLDLRAALQDAAGRRRTVVRGNVVLDDDSDDIQLVRLTVDPLPDREGEEALFLVLFEDEGPALRADAMPAEARASAEGVVASLDRDLRDTRERLQSMIEDYETAIEELKSSNEELVSVNEELQSTNEELEASKEELQSLNEELHTVNLELTNKLDDLDRANSDLKNLFESTEIATVFLDRALVIRSFTPAVSRIFRVIPGDRGRPLTDLAIQSAYSDLEAHVRTVFETGVPFEHRIAAQADDTRYLVRLIPYRGKDETVDGVVVTFVDVTSLAHAEEQQDVLIAELNHRVKNMLAVAISITRQMKRQNLPVDLFCETLIGRLHAMADAYELVARANWTAVRLDEIVERRLAPFGSERFAARGPAVSLTPKVALSMGMVLHELATNAAQHGAFANDDGRVDVTWTLEERRLSFAWTEHGGPAPQPISPGFGLKLIDREITFGRNGRFAVDAPPEGITVSIAFAV